MHTFLSIKHFFAMGGYAAYVWTCYGVASVILIFLLQRSIGMRRKLFNELHTQRKQLRTKS